MTTRRRALGSRAPLATSLFISLILVFLFTLPGTLAKAEPAEPPARDVSTVNPGDMNTGALLLQSATRYGAEASNLNVVDFGGKPGLVDPVPDRDRISPPALDPEKTGAINLGSIQVNLLTMVPQDFNQRIAMLALVLAFLSTLTFIMWLYHRRDYASPRRIGRRN